MPIAEPEALARRLEWFRREREAKLQAARSLLIDIAAWERLSTFHAKRLGHTYPWQEDDQT